MARLTVDTRKPRSAAYADAQLLQLRTGISFPDSYPTADLDWVAKNVVPLITQFERYFSVQQHRVERKNMLKQRLNEYRRQHQKMQPPLVNSPQNLSGLELQLALNVQKTFTRLLLIVDEPQPSVELGSQGTDVAQSPWRKSFYNLIVTYSKLLIGRNIISDNELITLLNRVTSVWIPDGKSRLFIDPREVVLAKHVIWATLLALPTDQVLTVDELLASLS